MILSIIVPMYNVERYIGKCLQSCLSQDISPTDYEIIIVNDGSPDNSILIAEEFANKKSNIHIINQENQGLSVARNTGLKHAQGKYVWFIDSDDWIEENCLQSILFRIEETTPDFLQLQFKYVYDNQEQNRDSYCIIDGVVTGVQQIENGGVPIPAPFVIYRRDFLIKNNFYFYPGIFHEDCEFKPRVLFLAKRCASYDKVVYNYYQRSSGSITTIVNPKRAYDLLKVALSIDEFYVNVAKCSCSLFFHDYISLMINNAMSVVTDNKKDFSKELAKHKHLYTHLRKSLKLKYKIEGYLFALLPNYSAQIYKFLKSR